MDSSGGTFLWFVPARPRKNFELISFRMSSLIHPPRRILVASVGPLPAPKDLIMLPSTKVKSLAPAGIRGTFTGREGRKHPPTRSCLYPFANPFHHTSYSNESTYSAKTYLDVLISFTPGALRGRGEEGVKERKRG